VKLGNTGKAPLNISGIAATGDFAQAKNCGSVLAAGAQCNISVTFTPTVVGTESGAIGITDITRIFGVFGAGRGGREYEEYTEY